jgi:peptide/nickel transport system substrate-binding protein
VRRRPGAVLIGVVSVALAGIGCTKDASDEADAPAAAEGSFRVADNLAGPAPAVPGARPGGTVTILAAAEDLDDPNPQRIYNSTSFVIYTQLLYRTLTGYYEDVADNGAIALKLAGDLATDTGRTTDGCRTWTYTLREGIKFSDGAPITSKDVAHGVSRAFDVGLGQGPRYLQKYLTGRDNFRSVYTGPFEEPGTTAPGISTPDAKTIIFRFAKPHCDLPMAATLPTTAPVPAAKDPSPLRFARNPVTSGPYRIQSWIRGERLTLVRNANWDPNTDPLRHAYPDSYVVDSTDADPVALAKRLIADEGVDQTSVMLRDVAPQAMPDVVANAAARARLIEGDTGLNLYLNINTQRVVDVDVRRAINYAYDKAKVLSIYGGGVAGEPLTTITAPTVPGYRRYDAYPAPLNGDAEKAKALLSGKTVPPLKFCYQPGDPVREQAAVAVKEALERAGLVIVMAPTDAAAHYDLIGTKGTDCGLMTSSWGQDFPSNSTVMGVLMRGGSAIQPEGNFNWSYFDNAEVNAELDRIAAEPDPQKAAEAYMALDERVMRDFAPLVPVMNRHRFNLRGSRIGGGYLSRPWGQPSLQNVYVKP